MFDRTSMTINFFYDMIKFGIENYFDHYAYIEEYKLTSTEDLTEWTIIYKENLNEWTVLNKTKIRGVNRITEEISS
jgi:hypothetical protein